MAIKVEPCAWRSIYIDILESHLQSICIENYIWSEKEHQKKVAYCAQVEALIVEERLSGVYTYAQTDGCHPETVECNQHNENL